MQGDLQRLAQKLFYKIRENETNKHRNTYIFRSQPKRCLWHAIIWPLMAHNF